MKTLTREEFDSEFKIIRENNYTLEDYVRASRVGCTFALNRKTKKYIYSAYCYNKENKLKYEAQNFDRQNKHSGLSLNGNISYDAICKYRDEVMYIDA